MTDEDDDVVDEPETLLAVLLALVDALRTLVCDCTSGVSLDPLENAAAALFCC